MKVLIVEDDFSSRIVLRSLLEPFGDVHIAVNGKEALMVNQSESAKRVPFDLICLDIMTPEMDGQSVLKEIRRQGLEDAKSQAPKIIMTSALSDPENILTAFREQCEGYLVKPFVKEKLFDLLRELELIG